MCKLMRKQEPRREGRLSVKTTWWDRESTRLRVRRAGWDPGELGILEESLHCLGFPHCNKGVGLGP